MGVAGKRDEPNSVVEGKMKKRESIITLRVVMRWAGSVFFLCA